MWRRHIPSLVEKNLTTTSSAPLHLFFFCKWKTITANNINPNLKKIEGCSGKCNHASTFCCVFFMIYIKRKDWISVQGIETKIDETWSIKSWVDQIMRDAIRKSTFPNGKKNVIPKKKKNQKNNCHFVFLLPCLNQKFSTNNSEEKERN